MLRIARDVAWLRLGSCTDHVVSAAATTPHSAITPSPASSRNRRAKASRIEAGNWPTRGSTRSIAGMLMGPCDWKLNEWSEVLATTKVHSLSRWEKVGVRGYGLSLGCNPSPGSQ